MNRFLRIIIDFFRNPRMVFQSSPTDERLKSLDVVGFADYLQTCKNVVVLVGAGISTAAGIPDFRSPNSGIYSIYMKHDLPYPEALFSHDYFMKNPKPFFDVVRTLYPKNLKPTTAHYFVKLLQSKKKLRRIFTQNVDCLELMAGLPPSAIINAHGTFATSHCVKCKAVYYLEWLKEQLSLHEVPLCSKKDCHGVVKPDVVLFGETLPTSFFSAVREDMEICDCLIIMGTSLNVQPFASIISRVPKTCPRLLINKEDVGISLSSDLRYDLPHNYRDLFLKTTADDGCMQLAKAMGLEDELQEIIRSGNARIDQLYKTEGSFEKEIKKVLTEEVEC